MGISKNRNSTPGSIVKYIRFRSLLGTSTANARQGPFTDKAVGADSNGFRLLICDRSLQDPITVLMSKASFSEVVKCFGLAPETKASILQILGGCGKHIVVTQPDNQTCLQIVMKAYQKGEIGNFMLSLCYNFETAWTDALVCWTDTPWQHGSRMQDRYFDSGLDHILRLLVCWKDLWAHPTGIPLALLQSYSRRTEQRCNNLNTSLVELDCELGVNRADRMYSAREMETWPSDLDFKSLTVGLHSASNRITFVHQSSQWVVRCTDWMLDLENEIGMYHLPGNTRTPRIQEFLHYRRSVMKGVEIAFEGLKVRSQAATNVVRRLRLLLVVSG